MKNQIEHEENEMNNKERELKNIKESQNQSSKEELP